MELEYETLMIPIDEAFQDKVKAKVDDRWEILPGTKPVAIYHLVRIKQQIPQAAGIGGFGSLNIDESKITVIRGGKVVKPDGTVDEGGTVHDAGAKLG